MNKNKILVVLNTLSFLAVLFVSYASQTRLLSNITMPQVAHKYDTLFAPADYAFAIWSVIYISCAAFIMYEWKLLKADPKQYISRTGIWFMLSNIANALWVFCWVHEWLGWCVVLMPALLCCLIILTVRLRLEHDDEPVKNDFFCLVADNQLSRMDRCSNSCLCCSVVKIYWVEWWRRSG